MIFIIFIFGLLFGSFYTVVGLRLPEGKSIFKPNSHCDNCEIELKWYELIPLVSYLLQWGKCKKCGAKIPLFYFCIELLTGLLFALCYYLYGFNYEFYTSVIIASVLIIIFVSDFKFMIILDSPLLIGTITVLILKYCYFGGIALRNALISSFLMFMFLLLIKFWADKFYKREALGGGDVKLSLLTGAVLGMKLGLSSIIIASFLAVPYAVYGIIKNKDKEIPFGPFLISGLFITFIFMEIIANFIRTYFFF